jgi:hypothetical protein
MSRATQRQTVVADNLFRALVGAGLSVRDFALRGAMRVHVDDDTELAVQVVRGQGTKVRFILHRCELSTVDGEAAESERKVGELEDWRDVVLFVVAYVGGAAGRDR